MNPTMTSQTNTGSGSIAQGQNSTSAGERGIAATDISGSTIATGDNATINNIIIVGRFLELAQVEGLLPKIEDREDFSSITHAIEGALNSRLNGDLAEATAFAGEILSDFVYEQLEKYTNKPLLLTQLVPTLIVHVVRKLKENGYWEAYARGHPNRILSLDATTMLYTKNVNDRMRDFGIEYESGIKRYRLVGEWFEIRDMRHGEVPIKDQTPKVLRIFIAGIVLDLIRIYSDNRISVQFLQEMANLFIQHKPQPTE